jgi:integrase
MAVVLPKGISLVEYRTQEGRVLKYRARFNSKKHNFKGNKLFDTLDKAKAYLAECKSVYGREALTGIERGNAIARLVYGNPDFSIFLKRFYEYRYQNDLLDSDGNPSYLKRKRNITIQSFYKTICETKIGVVNDEFSQAMTGFTMLLGNRVASTVTLGKLKPQQITYKHINAYVKARLDMGKKKSTVRKELSLISCFFDEAKHIPGVNALLLPELNPCNGFDKKLLSNVYEGKIQRRIEPEEWDNILSAIINVKQIEFSYILLFSLFTAMRRSEVCNLKWEYIHNTFIMLPYAKKGRRKIILTKDAKDLIAIIAEDKPERKGKVFDMSISTFEKAYQRYSKKYGFTTVNYHMFRKESISRAIEKIGVNPLVLAEVLGFKNVVQFKKDYLDDVEITSNKNTDELIETQARIDREMRNFAHTSMNTTKGSYFSLKIEE